MVRQLTLGPVTETEVEGGWLGRGPAVVDWIWHGGGDRRRRGGGEGGRNEQHLGRWSRVSGTGSCPVESMLGIMVARPAGVGFHCGFWELECVVSDTMVL